MDNVRQLQSERNKLQHLAHKSNSVNLWSKLREERNNLRTKSKQDLVKQLFYQRALSSSKPKELWQVIHHMLHPSPQSLKVDPDLLNNHFTSTSQHLLGSTPNCPHTYHLTI